MRPITLGPFTPAIASETAFNAQGFTSDGAAVAPTVTETTDGLAHLVTMTAPDQDSLAGVDFTIVGTSADGHALTDVLAGPAGLATVTSTNLFKTITTIQPSEDMGALTLSIGIDATAMSPTIALTNSVAAAGMTVAVTGTINYTMYETFCNVYEQNPSSTDVSTAILALTSKDATTSANSSVSATGVLLVVNSFSEGATFTVYLNQSSAGLA